MTHDTATSHLTDTRPTPGGAPERAIWHGRPDLDAARRAGAGCVIDHLGIELTELGTDHLTGRMPVDNRTRQPFGLLHGGASVLLAETLVSFAATFVVGPGRACVGVEINANHVRPVTTGWVVGTARPISLGRRLHVWEARICDDENRLVCLSRCTLAVVDA
ncbi:hotdog fold thioesterase [Actinotalea sp. M2MS4P-6]|uniref:PaaI family thioesterase n=1 Tax=Actinotalea sp. M2MS4P-6 TaxID=2983762 RepID=UPI0021E47E27|nr:hotdog fold thioesterase [Actinotalea sp. M2MS4P-6]MCV2392964.1 hotdog fold thioesterase [Actinotalea sp. M2MS4P-6]